MLKTRVITALILVAVLSWLLFFSSHAVWFFSAIAISIVAGWEWARFAKINSQLARWGYGFLVGVLVFLFSNVLGFLTLATLVFISVIAMTVLVFNFQKSHAQSSIDSKLVILGLGSLVLSLFFISMIQFRLELSPALILYSFMVIWAIDTGAYFTGKAFGKRKLAKYVSPGKTWEGVYGGALLAFIIALVGLWLISPEITISYWVLAVVMALIGLYSVIGDLFESLLKRQVNLKDSSQVLPGHGGVLDRIDSALLAIPICYLLWRWVTL